MNENRNHRPCSRARTADGRLLKLKRDSPFRCHRTRTRRCLKTDHCRQDPTGGAGSSRPTNNPFGYRRFMSNRHSRCMFNRRSRCMFNRRSRDGESTSTQRRQNRTTDETNSRFTLPFGSGRVRILTFDDLRSTTCVRQLAFDNLRSGRAAFGWERRSRGCAG